MPEPKVKPPPSSSADSDDEEEQPEHSWWEQVRHMWSSPAHGHRLLHLPLLHPQSPAAGARPRPPVPDCACAT